MVSCLNNDDIAALLGPLVFRWDDEQHRLSLDNIVNEILSCAQSFVPCEAGSLMLRNCDRKSSLVFVGSFGTGSDKLPGKILPEGIGIASQVLTSGEPILTNSPSRDTKFYSGIDELTDHVTRSLVCVPIKAYGESIGVLSLLNGGEKGFREKDLSLLEVFCGYLTQSIQLIFEAKKQKRRTMTDHLTGLFNDRFLYQSLSRLVQECLESGNDLGLIFLDLDHFKAVVDTHGHLVGSQALREFGKLIGRVVESQEAIAARYGGDEYVVVVPQADHESLSCLAEDLRTEIQQAQIVCEGEEDGEAVRLEGSITASVGVARLKQLPLQAANKDKLKKNLVRCADQAMYAAKAAGKNRVVWHDPRR